MVLGGIELRRLFQRSVGGELFLNISGGGVLSAFFFVSVQPRVTIASGAFPRDFRNHGVP